MTMITPSYLGETIEYSSLHACRSTLEDPTAIANAAPGDTVLAAGKGHEKTLETGSGEIPWNERAVVTAAIRRRIS